MMTTPVNSTHLALSAVEIEKILSDFGNTLNFKKALDISIPADEHQYVGHIQHSGKAHLDEIVRFSKALKRSPEGGVFLFSGQVGSGKSTELLRLCKLLKSNTCKVFYVDLEKWLNLNMPITLSGLMVCMMAGWIEQAGNQTVGQRSVADKLVDFFTKTKLTDLKLKLGNDIASIQTGFQNDENFRSELEQLISSNKNSFVKQAHGFALEHKQEICPHGEDCILVIDSLEKIRGFGNNIENVYTSLEELFIANSAALNFAGIKIVYSIAPSLLEQNPQLAAINGQSSILKLPSLHVLHRESKLPDENGIEMMLQMLDKRYPDWQTIMTRAQARRIAIASGGDLRDFLRGINSTTFDEIGSFPLPDSSIEYAVAQIKPPLQIPQKIINWLARVSETHEACLDENISAHTLQHFLSSKHLLMYANGEVWYDVHPQLKHWVGLRRSSGVDGVLVSPPAAAPSA